jgi:dTDP-4-amino-4,6-dideoxy-D-galactose acyltransferase
VIGGTLTPELVARVDDWSAENAVGCMYFLADADDAPAAHIAEDAGFRLMDIRIELRRPAAAEVVDHVRPARESDRESLREIARSSHRITRFYADPAFPDDRCDALYDTWIAQSLDGWAEQVLVAEVDGSPAGYVSCHLDPDARRGSIGLIAVDERRRGAGIGVSLARAAVDWCAAHGAETTSVVTQARNTQALRTFERAGFVVEEVGLWFHKWYAA